MNDTQEQYKQVMHGIFDKLHSIRHLLDTCGHHNCTMHVVGMLRRVEWSLDEALSHMKDILEPGEEHVHEQKCTIKRIVERAKVLVEHSQGYDNKQALVPEGVLDLLRMDIEDLDNDQQGVTNTRCLVQSWITDMVDLDGIGELDEDGKRWVNLSTDMLATLSTQFDLMFTYRRDNVVMFVDEKGKRFRQR